MRGQATALVRSLSHGINFGKAYKFELRILQQRFCRMSSGNGVSSSRINGWRKTAVKTVLPLVPKLRESIFPIVILALTFTSCTSRNTRRLETPVVSERIGPEILERWAICDYLHSLQPDRCCWRNELSKKVNAFQQCDDPMPLHDEGSKVVDLKIANREIAIGEAFHEFSNVVQFSFAFDSSRSPPVYLSASEASWKSLFSALLDAADLRPTVVGKTIALVPGLSPVTRGNSLQYYLTSDGKPLVLGIPTEETKKSISLQSHPFSYTGRYWTARFQHTDLQVFLKAISEYSNLTFILGAGLNYKIDANFVEIPWDEALDAVLIALDLDKTQRGNLVIVQKADILKRQRERHARCTCVE